MIISGRASDNHFELDGTLIFSEDETVWDDLRISLYSRGGSSAPSYTSGFAGNSNLYSWYFPSSGLRSLYFETQLPHSWDGTTIYPHLHWTPTTSSTGNVRWCFEYTWANINSVFGASSILNIDETITTANQWRHLISGTTGGVTPTASQNGLSSILVGRVYRNGDDSNDTYPDSAALIAIDIHFQINTVGSRQEKVK